MNTCRFSEISSESKFAKGRRLKKETFSNLSKSAPQVMSHAAWHDSVWNPDCIHSLKQSSSDSAYPKKLEMMWPCDLSWIICWLNSPYPHSTSRWGIHGCELGYSGWYSLAFQCESCFILFRGMVVYQIIWFEVTDGFAVSPRLSCFPASSPFN